MQLTPRRQGIVPDWIVENAERAPDTLAFAMLNDHLDLAQTLTWQELYDQSHALAGKLAARFVPGSSILLLYPPGVDFIIAYCACLFAGMVAIPIPPYDPAHAQRSLSFIKSVATDAEAQCILCTTDQEAARDEAIAYAPILAHVSWYTLDTLMALPETSSLPVVTASNIAYIQYTSGSTSEPKGVVIEHAQLQAYFAMHERRMPLVENDVIVSWLPHSHDYALVGVILSGVYYRIPCYRMSTLSFLARPQRWLQAVTRYHGTFLQGPTFAYELCLRNIPPSQCAGLNLSAIRVSEWAGEAVRATTIAAFIERFSHYGFSPIAIRPAYGMAETVLAATMALPNEPYHVQNISLVGLARGMAVPALPDEQAIQVVGCGRPLDACQLLIVDPETRQPLPAGRVGEVWIHAPTLARGYHRRPEVTEATFASQLAEPLPGVLQGPYLHTGDLAFLDEDSVLYVTGRCKDVIIIDGMNHYPSDIEQTVELCHAGVMATAVAAFSVDDDEHERLVIWAEVQDDADNEEICRTILRAVSERHEIEVSVIQLFSRGGVCKTSSGKVQRHACRHAFQHGTTIPRYEWRRRETDIDIATPSTSTQQLETELCELLAARLGIAVGDIDVRQPVASYGLSSRQAVALAVELEDRLGISLPLTLFWRFPSIRAVVAFVSQQQDGVAPIHHVDAQQQHGRIAVIGMSGRLPGAEDLESFWQHLFQGDDAIREVPASRWHADDVYDPEPGMPGKTYVRQGGFLQQIDQFDAAFFGISGREAEQMDPQQRLLLEVAWEALEDAHIPADRLAGTDAGVFIGSCHMDFARVVLGDREQIGAYTGSGVTLSILANRLSYFLGAHGPSMTIDCACSSAMVAVHQACQALRNRECALAIAGGVNVIIGPETTIALSQAHMLAADGRCKAFADTADGYGRGEGCGVIILKRLEDALADGDPVLGIIHGTAVMQDGRSNGLTAPSDIGQALTIRRALADARLAPEDVRIIEAHGTGTALGDPIEVLALRDVFGAARQSDLPLWLGSVKSNIGHLEGAAGIAGILKVLLAYRHRLLPATLHVTRPNPTLQLDGTPIRLALQNVPLPADDPCYAGVSSFGFGGTLGHVILSAPPAEQLPTGIPTNVTTVLVISARSEAALRVAVQRYSEYLSTTSYALLPICAAAATSRVHFEYRLAAIGSTVEEMLTRLNAFLRGKSDEECVYGNVGANVVGDPFALAQTCTTVSSRTLKELAQAYVTGRQIAWSEFFHDVPSAQITLPHYPFQRKRYWPEPTNAQPLRALTQADDILAHIRELREYLTARETEFSRSLGRTPAALPQSATSVETYTIGWQPYSFSAKPQRGKWLVLDGGDTTSRQVRTALEQSGCRVTTLPFGPAQASTVITAALAEDGLCGVIDCWTGCVGQEERAEIRPLLQYFSVMQTVAASPAHLPVWTCLPTVHAITDGDCPRPEAGAVWGCAQVAALEHAEHWGGVVDVGEELTASGAHRLVEIMTTGTVHESLALRGDAVWIQQVEQTPLPGNPMRFTADGAWLITGAFGGIGLQLIRKLVSHGVRRLWLVSRRGPQTPAAQALLADLHANGVEAHAVCADAGNSEDMARVFEQIDASGQSLIGIMHAAGVSPAIMFDDYCKDDILSVADVKIRGALLLDAYSRRHPVQVFCVFSSIAAVFGGLGMAAYSAANYFMDTLMARRRHEGLPGVAVNWGPWGEVGMFTDEMWSRIGESGMQPVLPEPGMEALMRVIAGEHYQYLAVCGDMDHYVNSYLHHYKTALPSAPAAPPPTPVSSDASLCNDVLSLPAQQRYAHLLQLLQAEVVRILRLDDEQLDPQQGFFNIGMDSLTAIELRNSIKTVFGIALPPTVLFEAPCLADLTSALLEQMTKEKPASQASAASSAPIPDDLQAIIDDIDAAYTETV